MARRLVPKAGFGKRVHDAMIQHTNKDGSYWRPDDLAKKVGVSGHSVRGWIVRGIIPIGDNLQKLAECLGVTAEYLLSGRNFEDKSDKSGVSRNFGIDAHLNEGGNPGHTDEVLRLICGILKASGACRHLVTTEEALDLLRGTDELQEIVDQEVKRRARG